MTGHTAEITVRRQVPWTGGWAAPYAAQIAQRRYSSSGDATGKGAYRVERFTLRGTYSTQVGSLVRRRAGAKRLEVTDLPQPSS